MKKDTLTKNEFESTINHIYKVKDRYIGKDFSTIMEAIIGKYNGIDISDVTKIIKKGIKHEDIVISDEESIEYKKLNDLSRKYILNKPVLAESLRKYSSDDFYNTEISIDKNNKDRKIIHTYINNMSPLEKNIILYHSVPSAAVYYDHINTANINDRIPFDSFVSTTEDEIISKTFNDNNLYLEIHMQKGQKVLAISSVSEFPEEKEVLLDYNGNFNIIDIVENDDGTKKIVVNIDYKNK